MLFAGLKNRKTGETAMNKESSRSHSIFTIYIETAVDSNVRIFINKLKSDANYIGWNWQTEDQSWKA